MTVGRMVRMTSALAGVAGLAALGGLALPATTAYAATINVAPGDSIQAAVDSAQPGDTIRLAAGTFRESVEITKSITIIGAGQGSTRLVPPSSPPTSESDFCFDPSAPTEFDGMCIHGDIDPNTGAVTTPVGPVSLSRLTVKNYDGIGIMFAGATSPHVDHVTASNNTEYGIAAFQSSDDVLDTNIANQNGEAGLYVGDSPNAKATVTNNVAKANDDFGIFVRDSSGPGTVAHNIVRGNCGGILFLNTGTGANPSSWDAFGNMAIANDNECTPDGGPTAGGIGIGVIGVDSVNVHDNLVRNNQPSVVVDISGGVVVANNASHTTVTNNILRLNAPDILWDGTGTGNTFTGNRCGTSLPPGLC